MRKPKYFICKNTGADQLHGNPRADKCLSFCYIGSAIPLPPKSEISSLKPLYIAWFVLELLGNPEDRFSNDAANLFCLG